jgi:hypothetical protein
MFAFFHSVGAWLHEHDIFFALLLYVAGMYSSEVKRFIHSRPKTFKEGWKKGALGSISADIALLNRLHGNSYELLRYVVSEVTFVIWLLNIGIVSVLLVEDLAFKKITLWPIIFVSAGIITGRARVVREAVIRLYNYEKSIAQLEAQLARYQ